MSPSALPNKKILSTGELAAICHISKHTLIGAIEKGDLKASQTPGGHNRIRREDALDYMKSHNYLVAEVPDSKSDKPTILIVDDKRFVRDIVEEVFDGSDYRVFHAANGYQAGMLAERERPDLILLDILLPDIDGREVCRHIRGEVYGKNCRIVAVTSVKDPAEVKDIFAAGIDDYLAKPFSIDQLRVKVEAHLAVTRR